MGTYCRLTRWYNSCTPIMAPIILTRARQHFQLQPTRSRKYNHRQGSQIITHLLTNMTCRSWRVIILTGCQRSLTRYFFGSPQPSLGGVHMHQPSVSSIKKSSHAPSGVFFTSGKGDRKYRLLGYRTKVGATNDKALCSSSIAILSSKSVAR